MYIWWHCTGWLKIKSATPEESLRRPRRFLLSNARKCFGNHLRTFYQVSLDIFIFYIFIGDEVALLVRHRTCNLQIAVSSPGWAPLRSGLGQATYTCVPLTPSSIIWHRPRGDLFGPESNLGPGGK